MPAKAPEKEPVGRHQDRKTVQTHAKLKRDSKVDADELRDQGITGTFTVVVGYTVRENGSVSDVSVTSPSGNKTVDAAVKRAAGRYRYEPARVDGEPHAVTLTLSVTVRITPLE